ncbi:transposase [Micromonospora sp. WMMD1102]|uniref:transposase n=1 Tax=Micromonospora sp. WMMD1102 TaxID=3016105 RepID=UPI0024158C5D|nr:transposase [Micromonospora sp. WMMD1102]MDG4790144.1 transposase [Micromonospora sp. WMMD1102]
MDKARAFLLGLLSDVESRSCWQLTEQAGHASPHAMQRLLGEAVWDADKVRDDVHGYAVDTLGAPDGVLILDDTGDLKKGELARTLFTVDDQRIVRVPNGRRSPQDAAPRLGRRPAHRPRRVRVHVRVGVARQGSPTSAGP